MEKRIISIAFFIIALAIAYYLVIYLPQKDSVQENLNKLSLNENCHDKAVAFEDQLRKQDIWLINAPESSERVNDNTYVYSYNIAGYSYSQKYSTCFAHYGITQMPNYDYYGKNLPKGTDTKTEYLGEIYDTISGTLIAGVDPQIDCPNKQEDCNKAWEDFNNKLKSLDLE